MNGFMPLRIVLVQVNPNPESIFIYHTVICYIPAIMCAFVFVCDNEKCFFSLLSKMKIHSFYILNII